MQRVLVIGPCGSGKSVLARRLADAVGLPIVHLDAEYWRPGWVETPEDEWRERVADLIAEDRWIIDGNYGGTMDLRLSRADTVVYLDLARRVYFSRVLWRIISTYAQVRPDMAEGCPERLDFEFLRYVWNFHGSHHAQTEERLARSDAALIRLKTPAAVRKWIEGLEAAATSNAAR